MPSSLAIEAPCVLFRVNRLYRPGMDVDEVYDITRGWWRLGANREKVEYALGVADGVVRGAFRVLGWRARREGDENFHHDEPGKPRWGFDGEPADELEHLVGLDVSDLFAAGSQNPVRYLNLEGPAPDEDAGADAVPASLAPSSTSELEQVRDRLAANPVLHLSLGSKELFHSNLLGWLLETDEELTRSLFDHFLQPGPCNTFRVRRESHHLDLVIELPGAAPIVIENKVFSLPEEEQLERYSADNIRALGLGEAQKVLLSLTDPGWENAEHRGWVHVPWASLSGRLAKHLAMTRPEGDFVRELAARWESLLWDLSQVLELTRPLLGESLLLDGDRRAVLDAVRIGDAVEKARVRRFRHDLARLLGPDVMRRVDLSSAFGSGGPIVDIKVPLSDGALLGWQLQGQQWRRFLIAPEELQGKAPDLKQARIAYAQSQHLEWFDLSAVSAMIACLPAPNADFKHYAPGFVYDYVKVPEATIAELLKLAAVETERALAYAAERSRPSD